MKKIRNKLFILSYIGSLLLIVATVVPIIKFNNQSFAFIDEFFYLSFAIIILSTINLVLVTIKKYKISLIPTILNLIIIIYGIYKILNIDGLNLIKTHDDFGYGIAFILYPIGLIINIIGGLLTTNKNNKNEESDTINYEIPTDISFEVNEPQNIIEEDISLDYEEQIPISDILNKSNINQNDKIENNLESIDKEIANKHENNEVSNKDDEEIIPNENTDSEDINSMTINNEKVDENVDTTDYIENNNPDNDSKLEQDEDKNYSDSIDFDNNKISILDENDELLEEIEEYEYKDDEDFFEEIIEDNSINIDTTKSNDDKDAITTDINEMNDSEVGNENLDNEIPDLSLTNENIMINNIQVEDKPKPEFMAINPSDIKINEKNIPKKKEKKEEDSLKKLTKRNIPMTLGRTCQFCSTELGDDERICPICGRIN